MYFIQPPSANNVDNTVHEKAYFYYISGYVFPLISLVFSITLSAFFVNFRINSVLKQLDQMGDNDESRLELSNANINDDFNKINQQFNLLFSHKLFKSECSTLMSIHISFLNCLPIFYNWTIINYALSQLPTTKVFINIAQYLCLFPGASRKMNNILSAISLCSDLRFHQRFLLYQIFKIKNLRQSSVSSDANRKLAELKAATVTNYEDVMHFFQMKSSNAAYLEMICSENTHIDGKWEEAIRDYPNFQKFTDEYCSFLVECEMNLPRALVMKHRSNLIEMGRNFIVDQPFISLAKCTPAYLKKGIVDFQGSFKRHSELTNSNLFSSVNANTNNSNNNQEQHNSLSSNSAGSAGNSGSTGMSSSSTSMLSNAYNLDPEFEEYLGKQLFKQTTLRLEMNRSLSNRKSYASLLILYYSFFILIGGMALLIGIYLYIVGYIIQRSDSMYYLNLASKIRFYLDLSVLGSTLKFVYFTGRFTTLPKFNELDKKDDIDKHLRNTTSIDEGYNADMFLINDDIAYNIIHRNLLVSKDSLSELIIKLTILSFQGENVYELAHIMMYNDVPFTMCINGLPDYQVPLSLKTLEAYMHFLIDRTSSKVVDEGNWFNTDDICEILCNQPMIESSTLSLFTTLMDHEIALCDAEDKFIDIFSLTFPFVPLILYIVPIIVFFHLLIKDTNKVVNLLLGTIPEAKELAKKPIRKDLILEISDTSDKKPKSKHWLILQILLVLLSGLITFIIYYMISETKELNGDVKKLGRWNLLASIRMSCSVVSMNYMLTTVILNGTNTLNLTTSPNAIATRENMIKFCKETLVQLENSNEILLKGNDLTVPSSGFDKIFDEINLDSSCTVTNNSELHDSYRCVSCSQGVNMLVSMINIVLDDIADTHGNFDHEMVLHSLHLLNRHLLGKLEESVDRIHDINVILCKMLEEKTLIFFICGIIITIFTFVLCLFMYIKSTNIYRVAMMFIHRLPPRLF